MQANEAVSASLSKYGRETIAKGSKSFALASRLFAPDMRDDARLLYAWCRHCDDVIDGQDLGGDAPDAGMTPEVRRARLADLRRKTERALAGERDGEPPFNGLAHVARRRSLPPRYAMAHLDGFARDVEGGPLEDLDAVLRYCYGVAGVVGIMMAIVMGVDPEDDSTLDRACDLGLAFQLTNICRDVADDARGGRVYLPADRLAAAGVGPTGADILDADPAALYPVVEGLLEEAERYYASASEGVKALSPRAAAAIAAARNVYREIGASMARKGAQSLRERTIVPRGRKLWLAASGAGTGLAASLARPGRGAPARAGLWRRPKSLFEDDRNPIVGG